MFRGWVGVGARVGVEARVGARDGFRVRVVRDVLVLEKERSPPLMSSMPTSSIHLEAPRACVSPGFIAESSGPLMVLEAPKHW